MFKRLLLVLMLIPVIAFAQSSGKIAGVVIDKSTGEPLPGVNVILEGTSLGSATDIDGYYVILNVPVGVYSVRANYIGYKDVVIQNIRVSANITTEINFELEPTTLELEEAVVITAERPLVEKNVTSSVTMITSKELENAPIRNFTSIVATAKSVVVQDGAIHIRGGRADEVGYYIDGASTTNPLSNTQSLHVIQEAVEEFQVLAGGYTAEFGNANSGIIRTELKTGGPEYHFSAEFQTDKFADEGESFLDTYSYRHHNFIGTFSGPILSKKIRFFGAVENQFQGDRYKRFSEGFQFTDQIDANPENTVHDSIPVLEYPNGFTPKSESDNWAIQSTLLFDYSPLKFRISGSYNQDIDQFTNGRGAPGINTPMLDVLNDRYWEDVDENLLLTGKLTYVLSPKSFLEVTGSRYSATSDREDSFFGNDWELWYDSLAVAQHTDGEVQYRDRYVPDFNYLVNGIPFARNGNPNNFYAKNEQEYWGLKADFVTQWGRHHEIKVGTDLKFYTVRRFDVQPDVVRTKGANLELEEVDLNQYISNARPNNIGYDIYGNEVDDDAFDDATGIQTAEGPRNPQYHSVYFQDKIEYNDLIINAGLRYDYLDGDGNFLVNPTNPEIDENSNKFEEEAFEDEDPFQQISPRLGFSFPASEKTVFYMQYGKFIQMPSLGQMYAGIHRYNFEIIEAGFAFINPFGFGLDPIRTTSYEIGFRQQLGEVASFDLAGYYRNVKGQVQMTQIVPDAQAGIGPYTPLENSDFTTTKGLELGVTLRRTNRLQAQVNYTLTLAEGTNSTSNGNFAAFEQETPVPKVINPLDFSQTHRGSIVLDYRFGDNDGGAILQNLGLNVLFTFNSGHPYTPAVSDVGQANAYDAGVNFLLDTRARRARDEVGSATTPAVYNFDLRLDKSFQVMSNLDLTLFARVLNVFNIQNEVNVFPNTGSADNDGFINNRNLAQRNSFVEQWGPEYVDFYEKINITNGQSYWHFLGQELYSAPRQILFGIKLSR